MVRRSQQGCLSPPRLGRPRGGGCGGPAAARRRPGSPPPWLGLGPPGVPACQWRRRCQSAGGHQSWRRLQGVSQGHGSGSGPGSGSGSGFRSLRSQCQGSRTQEAGRGHFVGCRTLDGRIRPPCHTRQPPPDIGGTGMGRERERVKAASRPVCGIRLRLTRGRVALLEQRSGAVGGAAAGRSGSAAQRQQPYQRQ